MARALSRNLTLIKLSSSSLLPISHLSPTFAHRNRSTQRPKSHLVEVDLESSSSDTDVEVVGIKRLEDVIHGIIVRRSAPDWLPFLPGSSYWVPPKPRAQNIVELVGKLTNPLTEEEGLSLTTVRGWPSSSYFLEGGVSQNPVPVELEVEVHVRSYSGEVAKSEDDD
ncbi:hypothetical protein Nepgr_004981 [Nepenthes gracilis]|uniref:Uncharacterized protein n=1 Tax=Nepenthes gracilis TaxID=150966 RepID=A0AAD3S2D4_NEPGR|nr:hypothetical protein Nepgr_004981 [Nepenthes gracilis]